MKVLVSNVSCFKNTHHSLSLFYSDICISSVYKISSITSSVTLNLILSIRKFISLLISIAMFGNEFTTGHWLGTAAVFVGTLIYTISPSPLQPAAATAKKME